MLGNRVLLKWKEPRFAKKYIFSQLTAKDYISAYAGFIWKWALGSLLVFSFFRRISPRSDYSFFDLEILAIVLVIVACLSIVWLLRLFGNIFADSMVSLREKDILTMSAEGGFNLKYKDIQSCSIGKVAVNDREFNILEIKDWDGNESFVEIEPTIENEKIVEILKSKNVRIEPSLLNPL